MLNEGQCLLLKNRDLSIISQRNFKSDSEIKSDNKEIIEYQKSRKEQGLVNQIDILLFNYLSQELKDQVIQVLNNG